MTANLTLSHLQESAHEVSEINWIIEMSYIDNENNHGSTEGNEKTGKPESQKAGKPEDQKTGKREEGLFFFSNPFRFPGSSPCLCVSVVKDFTVPGFWGGEFRLTTDG